MKNNNSCGFPLKRCQAFYNIPKKLESEPRETINLNKEKKTIEASLCQSMFRFNSIQITTKGNRTKLARAPSQ